MFFGNYNSPGIGGFGNRIGLGFNMNNGFNGGMYSEFGNGANYGNYSGFSGQNRNGMQNFNQQNMHSFPRMQPNNRMNQQFMHQRQQGYPHQTRGLPQIPPQVQGQPHIPQGQPQGQPYIPYQQPQGQPHIPLGQPQGQPHIPYQQTQGKPQMPSPPNMNGFQNQQGAAPGSGNEQAHPDMDKLKNIGTFMGYPEYALADMPQAEKTAPAAGATGLHGNSIPQDLHTAHSDNLIDKIKQFSQNEKNSSEFYSNLAENTNSHATKDALGSIAKRAKSRSVRLGEIHKIHSGVEFSPVNKEIRTNVGLSDGIRLALREESLALKDCAEMAEAVENQAIRDKLNSIILEKLCQINELNYLNEI